MGWDDNGLPTERRVQNHFGVRCDPSVAYDPDFSPPAEPSEKEPVSVSRPNFVELCLRLTETDERAFEELWRGLGLSVDWSMTYTTIGERAQRISQRSFLALLARGEAYQLEAPTLWDVDFQTAVAQAELEDRERPGAMNRVRFRVAGGDATATGERGADRDDASGADPGVRRAAGAPRRRAPARARRQGGADAAVRHARARAHAPARRSREGHGPGDGVHVRRPDRRRLVARAGPAGAFGARPGRASGRCAVGQPPAGSPTTSSARGATTTSCAAGRSTRRASGSSSCWSRPTTSSASRRR